MTKHWLVRVDVRNRPNVHAEGVDVIARNISDACDAAERKAAMLCDGTMRWLADFHATHACEAAPGHAWARVG